MKMVLGIGLILAVHLSASALGQDGQPGNQVVCNPDCGTHEGDGKEAWYGWISAYPDETDLPVCDSNDYNLDLEFEYEGGWTYIDTENTETREVHWMNVDDGGVDDYITDTFDIALFCGHGDISGAGTSNVNSYLHFHHTLENENLFSWETHFGNVDLEWVVFDASYGVYIDDPNNRRNLAEWHDEFEYLHLLIGWHNSPQATAPSAFQFIDAAIDWGTPDGGGWKLKTAWFADSGGCFGVSNRYQTILAEDAVFGDDYIHGESTGANPDKPHDAYSTYWGNEC